MSLWDRDLGMDPKSLINLMVVGDSQYEMDAGTEFQKCCKLCLVKLVKLKELPTPDELAKQLALVDQKFEYMVGSFKNLNIKLEKTSDDSKVA